MYPSLVSVLIYRCVFIQYGPFTSIFVMKLVALEDLYFSAFFDFFLKTFNYAWVNCCALKVRKSFDGLHYVRTLYRPSNVSTKLNCKTNQT